MSVFRLPHRDQVEVEAGDNGLVRIRQEVRGEEDSLIFVHASDIDQLIEFLRTAKDEALKHASGDVGM